MPRAEVEHDSQYALLSRSCGLLANPHAALIELRGEDRKGWLQGQVTNDLRDLHPGGSTAFCILEPTGQILAVCRVWALPDRLLITTDIDCAPSVMRRIEQMVVLEDVQARVLSQELMLFSLQGPAASGELSRQQTLPTMDVCELKLGGAQSEGFALRNDRSGYGGWDLWLPHDPKFDFPMIDDATLAMAQLEAGIPKWGQDIGPKTLPNEMGRDFVSKHINFSKGCYTGQEVVQRIHSRGHTNRTWVGLTAEARIQTDDVVSHSSRQDAGVVTSAAVSPQYGPIGAAMLRNEALSGPVVVQTHLGPVRAEVIGMPFIEVE